MNIHIQIFEENNEREIDHRPWILEREKQCWEQDRGYREERESGIITF